MRLAFAIVLAMTAAACSSSSNVDRNLSTSAASSGGSRAGGTGGTASGGTGGGVAAGGAAGTASGGVVTGGAAGTESGGARGCGQPTLFVFDFYPDCDGTPHPVCVEIPPSNICYCDSTTSLDGGAPLRLPRSYGPCPGAGGRDADAEVPDAARD